MADWAPEARECPECRPAWRGRCRSRPSFAAVSGYVFILTYWPSGVLGRAVLHSPGGAVGRVWRQFPGALRSYRELSLAGLVGSVTWRPPTTVGSRDRTPTAFAAPHFSLSSYRGAAVRAPRGRTPAPCAAPLFSLSSSRGGAVSPPGVMDSGPARFAGVPE